MKIATITALAAALYCAATFAGQVAAYLDAILQQAPR